MLMKGLLIAILLVLALLWASKYAGAFFLAAVVVVGYVFIQWNRNRNKP